MVQAYQGYFRKGRFISQEAAEIPDDVEAYVMLTGKKLFPAKTKAQQQLEAFEKFVSLIRSIEAESLTEDDFAELENNRANFGREVAL